MSSYLSYELFTSSHKAFITSLDSIVEPTYYSQVTNDPKWVEAMNKELKALEANHTWTLIFLPPKKILIGCK